MNHPENSENDGVVSFLLLRFVGSGVSLYRLSSETHGQVTLTFLLNNYLRFPRSLRTGQFAITATSEQVVSVKRVDEDGLALEHKVLLLGLVDPKEIIEARVVQQQKQRDEEENWRS